MLSSGPGTTGPLTLYHLFQDNIMIKFVVKGVLVSNNPIIGVTMGDPSGIGPEVVTKALSDIEVLSKCSPLVVGNFDVLKATSQQLKIDLNIEPVSSIHDMKEGFISVLDMGNLDARNIDNGVVSAASGKASVEWIIKAGEMALSGEISGMATAPINKESARMAGYDDIGHMEILQSLTSAKQVATMLTAGNLRVVHLTTHRSLAVAIEYVKKDNVLAKLQLTNDCFYRWGYDKPRIAVAALNPHGGEGGLLGREEVEEILPAVELAQAKGMDVHGPIPADSVFPQAIDGQFDAVLVLYHDQGHIPIKVKDFHGSVSINLGFPFVRTSVDHGTAFDIAGIGIANAIGMKQAILTASYICTTGHLPN